MRITREPETTAGFLFSNPFDDLPALTHCGDAECSPRHSVAPHEHEGFEFVYVSRGQAAWGIGGKVFPQRSGEIFFTHPRDRHGSAGTQTGREFHHLWVGIVLDKLGHDGQRLAVRLRARTSPIIAGCDEVEPILQGIIRQLLRQGPDCESVVRNYLDTFVAVVHQRLSVQDNPDAGGNPLPFCYTVEKALAFMGRVWDRKITLAELARVAGASSSTLSAAFGRYLGVSPMAHHLTVRLDHARWALRQPGSTIADVAHAHGFSSSQHFSTAFRRVYGITPRVWQAA